ncbi:hypothetical protein M758_1G050900 [Ceratodon purpureus]|nr:hypothetical protein M758_1G050900 [Ceratodon purpureus]
MWLESLKQTEPRRQSKTYTSMTASASSEKFIYKNCFSPISFPSKFQFLSASQGISHVLFTSSIQVLSESPFQILLQVSIPSSLEVSIPGISSRPLLCTVYRISCVNTDSCT